MISFLGQVPASKSLLNRALLVRSYFPELKIRGDSDCDDVEKMKAGWADLSAGRPVNCGESGTVLRFLALRASRLTGEHRLTGTERLLNRPHQELQKILSQLGVPVFFGKNEIRIVSDGWRPQGDTLSIPSQRSSQFVSAVLLNSWKLPFDLYASPVGAGVSEGYWRMTQKMVTELGMKVDRWDNDFRVPAQQTLTRTEITMEPDMSSAFALAGLAAAGGSVTLTDFPGASIQPDFLFVDILEKMGVPIAMEGDRLKVQKARRLQGVSVKLTNSPDLFPVLAALCSLAEGESELYGAPQLVYKESNRIEKVRELLQFAGRIVEPTDEGVRIRGEFRPIAAPADFDPDQDHRLAMAAAVLRAAGVPIRILHPEVVKKSFPGFWRAAGEPI